MNAALPTPARFSFPRLSAWLACGAGWGVFLAWLSVRLQKSGFAPVGVLSLLIGLALGAGLWGLLRWLQFGHRRGALAGTLLLAAGVVGGEHTFAYCDYRVSFERAMQSDPKLAFARASNPAMQPRTFAEYMHWEDNRGRLWLWGIDAVLIALASTFVVAWGSAAYPYCGACESWYATTQSGSLRDATALRLGAAAGLTLPEHARAAQYRLLTCRSGCGPSRFELSYSDPAGLHTHQTRWLTAAQRRDVTAILESAQ